MGSASFNLWKIVIILFCLVAFGVTVAGFSFTEFADVAVEQVKNIFDDGTTLSYRYNSNEGNRFAVLKKIEINGMELSYETVDDEEGIQQGLSDRPHMDDDDGLLFVMPTRDIHPFWMYHMNFPIDMIWIDDGEVVEIAPNMLPPGETAGIPMTHTPRVMADMVLELTAGGAERYGLEVGDKVDF